jgi:hypothetical protein
MRFGYSPGWAGRSQSGLGPCAEYLTTGQWPAPMAGAMPPGMGQGSREQRLAMLQAQATMLEQQLQAIRQELEDIEQS